MKALYLPLVICAGTAVAADCPPHLEPFLYCQIEGGRKEVRVCFDGNEASYGFGPIGGAPELALSLMISEGATYYPWQGVGREIAEAIDFSVDGFTYSAYGGFDRVKAVEETGEPRFGGVRVYQGKKLLAELTCIPGTVEWAY